MRLRRRSERDELLYYLDHARPWVRPLCGALLLGVRRGGHVDYQGWLDKAETALGLLDELRESIKGAQDWPSPEQQHKP